MDDGAGVRPSRPPSAPCVLFCWAIAARPTVAVKAFIWRPCPALRNRVMPWTSSLVRPIRSWTTAFGSSRSLASISSRHRITSPPCAGSTFVLPRPLRILQHADRRFPRTLYLGQRLKAHFLAQGNPYDVVHDNQTLALGCWRSSAGAYPGDHDSPPHSAGPRPGPRSQRLEGAPRAALAPFSTHAGASRSPAEAPGHGLRRVPGRHRRGLRIPTTRIKQPTGWTARAGHRSRKLPGLLTRPSPWPADQPLKGLTVLEALATLRKKPSYAHAPGDRQAQPRRPHRGAAPGLGAGRRGHL